MLTAASLAFMLKINSIKHTVLSQKDNTNDTVTISKKVLKKTKYMYSKGLEGGGVRLWQTATITDAHLQITEPLLAPGPSSKKNVFHLFCFNQLVENNT